MEKMIQGSLEVKNSNIEPYDIELSALEPIEMVNSQQQLIVWCDSKLIYLKRESADLKAAYEHAIEHKYKSSTLKSQYEKSIKKIEYYEKIKAALLEGYYIVPNFPIQMFAIKTNRKRVKGRSAYKFDDHKQDCVVLAIGEGEYKNPFPLVERQNSITEGGKEIQSAGSRASDWDDIDFPITMAKPKIMEATTNAMALKIFDQIGVMPATRNEDPVIIGQIIRKSGYITKTVSFMIAWHLDTNVL